MKDECSHQREKLFMCGFLRRAYREFARSMRVARSRGVGTPLRTLGLREGRRVNQDPVNTILRSVVKRKPRKAYSIFDCQVQVRFFPGHWRSQHGDPYLTPRHADHHYSAQTCTRTYTPPRLSASPASTTPPFTAPAGPPHALSTTTPLQHLLCTLSR